MAVPIVIGRKADVGVEFSVSTESAPALPEKCKVGWPHTSP